MTDNFINYIENYSYDNTSSRLFKDIKAPVSDIRV